MSNLIKGKATICIVNYKTLDFARLCLRSICKFTNWFKIACRKLLCVPRPSSGTLGLVFGEYYI